MVSSNAGSTSGMVMLNSNSPSNVFHDFINENKAFMVIGGFGIIKKPTYGFILNIVLISLVLTLYIFILGMLIITITIKWQDKMIVGRIIQLMVPILAAIIFPIIHWNTYSDLKEAVKMINNGIFSYRDEEGEEWCLKIQKNRVRQIRVLGELISKLGFCSALMNSTFIPLMTLFFGSENSSDDILNPYLPIPIYMPFNTKTYFGYGVALFSISTCQFFAFTCSSCFVIIYVSCSLQLISQFEVLNHSLNTIEKRATAKFLKKIGTNSERATALNESQEFQKCLYLCLRENALHHQTILRFYKAIVSFMEKGNFGCMLMISILIAASIIAMIEYTGFQVAVVLQFMLTLFIYHQICNLAQFITDKSFMIGESLYSTPWQSSSRHFNILLKIMIINTKEPVTLKATWFNTKICLATFGDMISAGYKLINILR